MKYCGALAEAGLDHVHGLDHVQISIQDSEEDSADRIAVSTHLPTWRASPAFKAFRGSDWMIEPCRSCERRERDFGGCRCQAFVIAGDARAADPVCHLSPHHALIEQVAALRDDYIAHAYRRI